MRRTVLAVLAVVCAGLALPAGGARADGSHDVGLTGFADLVVDQTHGEVFISQHTGQVVVTDLDGAPLGTLDGLPGANGMVVSDDGSRLYVALSAGHGIARVDTSDPFAPGAVTTYATGSGSCPDDLAYAAGLVWYGTSCHGEASEIHALDPATGTVYDPTSETFSSPRLFSGPGLADSFFVGDRQVDPQRLYKAQVTGLPDPSVTWDSVASNAASLAVTHDGTAAVTGLGRQLATSDLTLTDTYPVAGRTNAVAIRSSDDLIAFGTTHGVAFYRPGGSSPSATYLFDDPHDAVVKGGLAFGAASLYAVTKDPGAAAPFALQVLTPRNRPRAHVSVAVSGQRHRYGGRATVTVSLHGHTSTSHIDLTGVTRDGTEYFLKSGRPDSHGRMRVRVTTTVAMTYIATFEGDAARAAASASKRVRVQARVLGRMVGTTRHAGKYAVYPASKKLIYTAVVSPDKQGQCVRFQLSFRTRGRWSHPGVTSCVTLDQKSGAAVYLQGRQLAGMPIRLRARWSGDRLNTHATSRWSYARFAGPGASPKRRTPLSQQTARSQSSPSSSPASPLSWVE